MGFGQDSATEIWDLIQMGIAPPPPITVVRKRLYIIKIALHYVTHGPIKPVKDKAKYNAKSLALSLVLKTKTTWSSGAVREASEGTSSPPSYFNNRF